jgi:hypothetical protein
VRAGRARALCKEVAKRVARSSEHSELVRVMVVGARFDPVVYLTEGRKPLGEKRHARCRVRR